MGDYNKRGGFGGNGGFGGGDRGGFGGKPRFGRAPHGNRDFGPKQMFSAVCAECGKTCEVPFRPNGEKPVYCNACFGKNKPNDFGSSKSFSSASRPQADNSQVMDLKRQVNEISAKLDKVLGLLTPKSEIENITPVAKKEKTKTKKTARRL